MDSSEVWLETDYEEESLRTLEFTVEQLTRVIEDSYRWKWVIIALHNSLQAFMVKACSVDTQSLKPTEDQKEGRAHPQQLAERAGPLQARQHELRCVGTPGRCEPLFGDGPLPCVPVYERVQRQRRAGDTYTGSARRSGCRSCRDSACLWPEHVNELSDHADVVLTGELVNAQEWPSSAPGFAANPGEGNRPPATLESSVCSTIPTPRPRAQPGSSTQSHRAARTKHPSHQPRSRNLQPGYP
jgi:hypothetical protein